MSKAYSNNLTQWQWELIQPLIPPQKHGGRSREVEVWSVLNAIFYLLTQGCTWRNLPGDFPAWQTVYTYFRNWRLDGTWFAIHERLRDWVRSQQQRQPEASEAIIDSQSVKAVAMVNQSVGYDAGKQIKGRKRFVTVDTLGLVLSVFVTTASQTEREGGKIVLQRLKEKGKRIARLHIPLLSLWENKNKSQICNCRYSENLSVYFLTEWLKSGFLVKVLCSKRS
jgi:putative transposase